MDSCNELSDLFDIQTEQLYIETTTPQNHLQICNSSCDCHLNKLGTFRFPRFSLPVKAEVNQAMKN